MSEEESGREEFSPESSSFELAPQDETKAFWGQVARVLDVLGHPEALVTDESKLRDFSPYGEDTEAWFAELEKRLAVEDLDIDDRVVDVAKRLPPE